jgi:hypothetical protein
LKPASYLVILSHHEDKGARLKKEVAVGTVIQYTQRSNEDLEVVWTAFRLFHSPSDSYEITDSE